MLDIESSLNNRPLAYIDDIVYQPLTPKSKKLPTQLFHPMKLHCNTERKTETKLNPNVEEFRPSRLKQTTAAVAKVKIRDIQF